VSHDYTPQRTLADAVDEDTLRRGPEEVRGAAFRPSA